MKLNEIKKVLLIANHASVSFIMYKFPLAYLEAWYLGR